MCFFALLPILPNRVGVVTFADDPGLDFVYLLFFFSLPSSPIFPLSIVHALSYSRR
jgi:hypothetical protein